MKKEETKTLIVRGVKIKLALALKVDAARLGISAGAWLNSAIEDKLKRGRK